MDGNGERWCTCVGLAIDVRNELLVGERIRDTEITCRHFFHLPSELRGVGHPKQFTRAEPAVVERQERAQTAPVCVIWRP